MTTQPARSGSKRPYGSKRQVERTTANDHAPRPRQSNGDGDGASAGRDLMEVDDNSVAGTGGDVTPLLDDELRASVDEEELWSFAKCLVADLEGLRSFLGCEADQAEQQHTRAVKSLEKAGRDVKRKTSAASDCQKSLSEAEAATKKAKSALEAARRKVDNLTRKHARARDAVAHAELRLAVAVEAERSALDNLEAARARLEAASPPPLEEPPAEEEPEPRPRSEVAPRPESVEAPTRRRQVKCPERLKTSAEFGRYLITRPGIRVLVDGYNLGMRTLGRPDEESEMLPALRSRFERLMHDFAASRRVDVTIVWDGKQDSGISPSRSGPAKAARVVFSRPGLTADEEIILLCESIPATCPVLVVSHDHEVYEAAKELGANTMTPRLFIEAFDIQPDATKLPSLP